MSTDKNLITVGQLNNAILTYFLENPENYKSKMFIKHIASQLNITRNELKYLFARIGFEFAKNISLQTIVNLRNFLTSKDPGLTVPEVYITPNKSIEAILAVLKYISFNVSKELNLSDNLVRDEFFYYRLKDSLEKPSMVTLEALLEKNTVTEVIENYLIDIFSYAQNLSTTSSRTSSKRKVAYHTSEQPEKLRTRDFHKKQEIHSILLSSQIQKTIKLMKDTLPGTTALTSNPASTADGVTLNSDHQESYASVAAAQFSPYAPGTHVSADMTYSNYNFVDSIFPATNDSILQNHMGTIPAQHPEILQHHSLYPHLVSSQYISHQNDRFFTEPAASRSTHTSSYITENFDQGSTLNAHDVQILHEIFLNDDNTEITSTNLSTSMHSSNFQPLRVDALSDNVSAYSIQQPTNSMHIAPEFLNQTHLSQQPHEVMPSRNGIFSRHHRHQEEESKQADEQSYLII